MKQVTWCALFVVVLLPSLLAWGCSEPAALTADMPLHLEEQLEAHLALGRHLTPSEAPPLTPAQLEALRSLGYIR